MSMYLPDAHKPKTVTALENENLIREKERLRQENFYYRSHLKELEVHKEPELDLRERLRQLDAENRKLCKINNDLQKGNTEMQTCFRTLADLKFEEK